MTKKLTLRQLILLLPVILGILFNVIYSASSVHAQVTNPQDGSIALEGTIPSDPPTEGATITFPTNGQNITEVPIDVTGICPNDLLVKLYKNEVFAGSAPCINGSFTITIDLFSGTNELVARVYDALDQPGPDSNVVTVNFDDANTTQALERVTLTTNYSRRGSFPGQTLVWPIIVTNGTPPYAITVQWGDGQSDLIARPIPGEFNIEHVYDKPGTYIIVVEASDANGTRTYLQLVAVINGPATGTVNSDGVLIGEDGQPLDTGTISQRTITRVLLWPLYVLLGLILVAFWFGKRYEIKRLRKRLANDQPLNF